MATGVPFSRFCIPPLPLLVLHPSAVPSAHRQLQRAERARVNWWDQLIPTSSLDAISAYMWRRRRGGGGGGGGCVRAVAALPCADLPPETKEPVPPRDTPLSHILAAFARKISHRRDAPVADTNYRSYRSYRGYVTEAAISRAPASRPRLRERDS